MLSLALAFKGFAVRVGLPSFYMDMCKAKQESPGVGAADRADCVLSTLGRCVLCGVCFSSGFFSYV